VTSIRTFDPGSPCGFRPVTTPRRRGSNRWGCRSRIGGFPRFATRPVYVPVDSSLAGRGAVLPSFARRRGNRESAHRGRRLPTVTVAALRPWPPSDRTLPTRATARTGGRRRFEGLLRSRAGADAYGGRPVEHRAVWAERRAVHRLIAGAGSARSVSDENPVRSESMTRRAVRRRLVDPTAVTGLDEIADHHLTVDRGGDA
jgi:hypothetical protein